MKMKTVYKQCIPHIYLVLAEHQGILMTAQVYLVTHFSLLFFFFPPYPMKKLRTVRPRSSILSTVTHALKTE